MTLALTAVALTEPLRDLEVLQALQEARYLAGRDNANEAVVTALLRGLGLNAAAEQRLGADSAPLATGCSGPWAARRL